MKQYFKMMMLALASVLMVLPLSAQQRIVKGTVTDDTGEPVAGASVMVAGTSRGVSTDLDGNFDIEAAAGETLVVSFIGFEDAKVKASSAVMNVVLYPDSELLEERYGLVSERIREIGQEQAFSEPLASYFSYCASFLEMLFGINVYNYTQRHCVVNRKMYLNKKRMCVG